MSVETVPRTTRELALRVSGGIEVRLLWSVHDNETIIEVAHDELVDALRFTVPPSVALEAFHHPFAHLPIPEGDVWDAIDA